MSLMESGCISYANSRAHSTLLRNSILLTRFCINSLENTEPARLDYV